MRIQSRRNTIILVILLGACLVALAIVLNISWIVLNWREVVPLVLGVIFFSLIIAGMVLNTLFLVREIRRNEQHDSFINAVTHELKTPIASIRLYLETLQNRDVDEAQRRQFYGVMLADTDRLLRTVEQVLRAGQARQRHPRRNWAQIPLGAVVRECIELARTRHNLQPQALRLEGPEPLEEATVLGDPDEIRSAITNVLDNAVKYSHNGIDVGVRFVPELDHVLVRVSDKGVGIPRPELKRIFKRFYRVRRSDMGRVKGTGLGLFIVKSIARKYGGEAFAESAGEGQGTTVTIKLPRVYPV